MGSDLGWQVQWGNLLALVLGRLEPIRRRRCCTGAALAAARFQGLAPREENPRRRRREAERREGKMSKRQGPPKHQNRFAWKPNLGQKINETEPGGRFRPLAEITGVCPRCRDQIDWKRRYGKYKPIVEPAKCQKCGKRNVRQAYHNVCSACSKDLGICAKCCTRVKELVGRDADEEEKERKGLEEAIKGARERERRTLLRLMNKGESGPSVPKIADRSREGDIFPAASSLDEYAEQARQQDDSDEEA